MENMKSGPIGNKETKGPGLEDARTIELQSLLNSLKNKNLYERLELTLIANQAEIEGAFKKLAIKYHPDRYPDNEGQRKLAEEIFKLYSEAKETLTNPEEKFKYDNRMAYERMKSGGSAEQTKSSAKDPLWNFSSNFNPNDIFGSGFGRDPFNPFGKKEEPIRETKQEKQGIEILFEKISKMPASKIVKVDKDCKIAKFNTNTGGAEFRLYKPKNLVEKALNKKTGLSDKAYQKLSMNNGALIGDRSVRGYAFDDLRTIIDPESTEEKSGLYTQINFLRVSDNPKDRLIVGIDNYIEPTEEQKKSIEFMFGDEEEGPSHILGYIKDGQPYILNKPYKISEQQAEAFWDPDKF